MAAIGLPGCASLSVPAIEASDDPYESVNRKVHGFNKALDKNLVRPLSTGYTAVVPPTRKSNMLVIFSVMQSHQMRLGPIIVMYC